MARAPKPLTERDWETLNELEGFNDSSHGRARGGARPLDLGGGSRSHHSATLGKLAKRGYVLKSNWAIRPDGERDGERGSCRYTITDTGREALKEYRGRKKG